MSRMQKPNPRQRQPVNVGLLELSLENLRKQIVLDVANRHIELIKQYHSGFIQPAHDDLEAHLLWHKLPWWKKLWLWIRAKSQKEVVEEPPVAEPVIDPA